MDTRSGIKERLRLGLILDKLMEYKEVGIFIPFCYCSSVWD